MQEKTRNKDFEQFFMEMYPPLMRYATSLTGDGMAAHDLVAAMFEKAWIKQTEEEHLDREHLRNWAYTTIHHACINHLRHLRVVHDNEREIAANRLYELTRDYKSHEQLLQKTELAIEEMEEPTRTILRLCALKRYTYQQAADIMGLSTHTIKKHISKAYAQLRHILTHK